MTKIRERDFTSLFHIASTDGRVSANDSRLSVSRASEAVIIVSIATSFNGFDKDPVKEGLDHEQITKDQIASLNFRSYYELKKAHVTDYQGYFNRVSLSLGSTTAPNLPTDRKVTPLCGRRRGQEAGGIVFPVWPLPADFQFADSRSPRQLAGNLESTYSSAMVKQLHGEYQFGGKLLAC
ncbi:MAG: hypothetical protein U5K79_23965 [Cyclobacteriaceae bacterium]|nr:hypothetical protein [Cyclobacteriaceae bacterium]